MVMQMTQPEQLPEFFYKYRSIGNDIQRQFLRDILFENRLYWSSPKQFNDPFDCSPVPTLAGTKAERRAYISHLARTQISGAPRHERVRAKRLMTADNLASMEANLNRIFDERLARVGICSLAEVGDNVLMWSHYADSHRGVCLRFNPTRVDRDFYLSFKVRYSADRPVVHVMRASEDEWVTGSLLTKAEEWRYEQEWRMFDLEGPGFHPFRPGLLDAVVLGALISPEHEDLVTRWVRDRRPTTKLLRARFDTRHFRLNLEPAD